jgi:hypothetical protein
MNMNALLILPTIDLDQWSGFPKAQRAVMHQNCDARRKNSDAGPMTPFLASQRWMAGVEKLRKNVIFQRVAHKLVCQPGLETEKLNCVSHLRYPGARDGAGGSLKIREIDLDQSNQISIRVGYKESPLTKTEESVP